MKKLLFALCALFVVSGCSTPKKGIQLSVSPLGKKQIAILSSSPKAKMYEVTKPFYLVVHDSVADLHRCLRTLGYKIDLDYYACYETEYRIIHVVRSNKETDLSGNYIPDPESVGHEILHLPELLGSWHKLHTKVTAKK